MHINGPMPIAYDGSGDARFAIEEAARLVAGADAIVLYVRQPLESVAALLEGHPALEEVRTIDAGATDAAKRLASEGARYARRAGLIAVPRAQVAAARQRLPPRRAPRPPAGDRRALAGAHRPGATASRRPRRRRPGSPRDRRSRGRAGYGPGSPSLRRHAAREPLMPLVSYAMSEREIADGAAAVRGRE